VEGYGIPIDLVYIFLKKRRVEELYEEDFY
jgi:hypothetical protein